MSDWPPRYSFLDKVAAEARVASRRYWAKGGAADRLYPVDEAEAKRNWPLNGDEPEPIKPPEPKTRRGFKS